MNHPGGYDWGQPFERKSGLTSMGGSIKTAATLDKEQMNIGCKFCDDKLKMRI
jgi:hypothetical protein